MSRCLHGSFGAPHRCGGLADGQVEEVAQQQDLALSIGEMRQRADDDAPIDHLLWKVASRALGCPRRRQSERPPSAAVRRNRDVDRFKAVRITQARGCSIRLTDGHRSSARTRASCASS